MGENVVKIDLKSNFSKYLTDMHIEGNNLSNFSRSIHIHAQSKIVYIHIEGKGLSPVMTTILGNKELVEYNLSLEYRLQSLYYQSSLIMEIIYSKISDFINNYSKKDNQIEQERILDSFRLQISTILDNLIIYLLSLIEYTLTFVSHLCLKKIENDWKKFYMLIKDKDSIKFIIPFMKKYNKTIISLKDYRNSLIHKKINGFPLGYSINWDPKENEEMFSFLIGISPEAEKMCKEFIFKSNLDYSNFVTLHYTISIEFIKICRELHELIFNNLWFF